MKNPLIPVVFYALAATQISLAAIDSFEKEPEQLNACTTETCLRPAIEIDNHQRHVLLAGLFKQRAPNSSDLNEHEPAQASSDAQSKECPFYAKTMRIAARHIEAGGIGYNQGYTTLEGFFAPEPTNWHGLPFIDLRGHAFNAWQACS